MDFGGALHCMLGGDKVFRESWARGIYLGIQKPDDHSKMNQRFLYMQEGEIDSGKCYPWCATHADLLADDWVMFVS